MKRFLLILVCLLLLSSAIGCNKQKLEPLGKCPVEMQTVTNKDQNVDATYTWSIPKGWDSVSLTSHSVEARFPGYTYSSDLDADISLMIGVRNYSDNHSQEDIQQYKNLFEGKTEEYKNTIMKHFQEVGGNASDFQFKVYKGTHGRIAEVKYTYEYQEKISNYVYCFREDIPYFAVGGLNSSNKLSSGDVLPWVMDSLQVIETKNRDRPENCIE
ncbi:hypothetical protein [Caproicibacter sp.]|uniref:hypothetical protein n=1 Tax=Caproicibacter sp. TaxID=2814884 RepID=UPI003988DEE0